MKDLSTGVSVFLGFLLISLSIPLILEKVPPNRWYGFRLPKTLSDERVWYVANRIAGYDLLIAGIVTLSTALLTGVLAWSSKDLAVAKINTWVLMISVGAAVLHSFWSLRRL